MTEKELIDLCIANDRNAQSELFRQYKDILFFTSLKYCRNESDAEDNLQDAFLTIFDKIKTFRNKGSFEGWMKRITIYKAIDKYKIKKPIVIEYNHDLLCEKVEIEEEPDLSLDQLLKLIQELPDQYRLVFNLYQLDGFSHNDIGQLLKISVSTSKSNYHRAKIILRDRIKEISNNPNSKNIPIGK